MKNESYWRRAIFSTAFALLASIALPLSNATAAADSDSKVETAGERAHFAQAFCQVPPERVQLYKERLKKKLSDVDNFDEHWQWGWSRANRQVTDMSALRDNNPQEFDTRIKVNCQRLKWMAENSLRTSPQK
jgi:hypothetical protein